MNSSTDSRQTTPSVIRSKTDNKTDLSDSDRDKERLQPEEITMDLPEVRDIPGQEHIRVAPLGELSDTTISSDDEEGTGILDEVNNVDNEDIRMEGESDLTTDDRKILNSTDTYPSDDEVRLQRASLDTTDFEGEPLNEGGFGQELTGRDLDVPGADADDENENIGEEDEENNSYSLGSDSNDQA